jgi:hypothetical protein
MCAGINDNSRFMFYIHPMLLQYRCCEHNEFHEVRKDTKRKWSVLLGFGVGVVVPVLYCTADDVVVVPVLYCTADDVVVVPVLYCTADDVVVVPVFYLLQTMVW